MLNISRLNLKQGVLVQPFNSLIQSIEKRTKMSEEQLVRKAFDVFEDTYPKWAESCFDIYFLSNTGKEALEARDAEGLAKAYVGQLTTVTEANYQEKMNTVIPVAQEFLSILAAQSKQAL